MPSRAELAGYEVREYVLEHFGRQCVYSKKTNIPLELDHLLPRSGDLVRAVVPKPLKTAGVHVGTISVRATGSCDLTTKHRRVGGVSVQYCRHLQRLDGYRYAQGSRALPPPDQAGSLRAQTQ